MNSLNYLFAMVRRVLRFNLFLIGTLLISCSWAIYFYWHSNLLGPIKRDHLALIQKDMHLLEWNHPKVKLIPRHNMIIRNTKNLNEKSKGFENALNYEDSNKLENIYPNLEELGMVRNEEDRETRDEGNRLYAFNALISDRLGYHRVIPDTRMPYCSTKVYNLDLPKVSIVICFYNEALSALLRTVHSVIDRSPAHLLHEIILVDDASKLEHLHEPLDTYISENFPDFVDLLRISRRQGLIRARMIGADHASGQVLVFLDSHCEVNVGWLEPLLDRIALNRTIVVTPIIDIINHDTFDYVPSPLVKGGFNWGLHFKWDGIPADLLEQAEKYGSPIRSPTMAGGLFAIDRLYFTELGKYDPGLEIWGGENLELSFRIWMCGGSLEIIPCSRVGHIFRKRRPYGSLNGDDTMTKNSLRVAHVWLDDYIENFLNIIPQAKKIEYGDISERLELRKQLHCQSFAWYLENVYPEMLPQKSLSGKPVAVEIPRNVFSSKRNFNGKYHLKHIASGLCLEPKKEVTTKLSPLWLQNCTKKGKRQTWYETDRQELLLAALLCLDAGDNPQLAKCHDQGGSQQWHYSDKDDTRLYNVAVGMCLVPKEAKPGGKVILNICQQTPLYQWAFEKFI